MQDALLLANVCSQVYIIHRRGEFRAEAANVSAVLSRGNITCLMNSRVVALEGEGELSGIVVEDKATLERRSIAVDGLFVAVGYEAANAAFAPIAKLDAAGWFTAGEDCAAGTPGVFAAGDCPGQDRPPADHRRGRRRGRCGRRLPLHRQSVKGVPP